MIQKQITRYLDESWNLAKKISKCKKKLMYLNSHNFGKIKIIENELRCLCSYRTRMRQRLIKQISDSIILSNRIHSKLMKLMILNESALIYIEIYGYFNEETHKIVQQGYHSIVSDIVKEFSDIKQCQK